ncbi:MAG: hypothetical protein HUJ76_06635 [Parasporobacterium sp.]|nr:hypothetical protein [Parasporobacterium sp.]
MKKLLAILVSAAMIFALAATSFAGEAAPTWADYQQYLIDTAGSNAPDLQEFIDQVMAIESWEALDQTVSPWDQMFTTIGLSTWEEFAQGIVKEAQVPSGENMGGGDSAEGESAEGESPEDSAEAPAEDAAPAEGESAEGGAEGESAGDSAGESKSDEDLMPLQNEEDGSALPPILETSFTGTKLAYPRFASYVNEDVAADINDDVSWHNGAIYFDGAEHTIEGKNIIMNTTADGKDTNDFSGLGAAVLTAGAGTKVNIINSNIETTGVAKLAVFTDNGGVTVIKGSTLKTNSGTIYEGYMSTADQAVMVAPPWVLGLGGPACNTRTSNIMGNYSVVATADSTFVAGGWGALSTDSGSNMHMVVANCDVEVIDSGYGAYTIGQSTEDYYGVRENVSTYVNIMTGGVATYASYVGGTVLPVEQYAGEVNEYGTGINGTVVAEIVSDKVAEGEVVPSVLNSANFGFMCHSNGSDGWNIVNVLEGTEVNTGDAIFLVKKVNSIFNVDGAVLNSANGTILQIIDNDDDYVGLDMAATWGEDNGYGHANGSHMPTFNSTFHEEAGYANEWAVNETPVENNWTSELNITNANVVGDVWNSSGYVGSNPATTLTVNIGEGASLTGLISAGAFSHVIKDAKVNDGDWSEAAALGHVTNIVNSNGKNIVNVNVAAGAVWNVTADCAIDALTVAEGGQVVVAEGVTLTVAGAPYDAAAVAPAPEAPAAPEAPEAPAAPAAEASDDDVAAYQAYLYEFIQAECAVNDSMTEEQLPEFYACIDALNFNQFPGDMFFGGYFVNGNAMTFDEFIASK